MRQLFIWKLTFRAQAQKLKEQGDENYARHKREVAAEVPCVGRFAQSLGDDGSGKDSDHIHDAVCRCSMAGKNELTQDGHIIGVEHPEPYPETKSSRDDHRQVIAEPEQQ